MVAGQGIAGGQRKTSCPHTPCYCECHILKNDEWRKKREREMKREAVKKERGTERGR